MQYLLLVYADPALMDALPAGQFDTMMKGCLEHADEQQRAGKLVSFSQLEDVKTARSVRIRDGQTRVSDGPFAETKELLGGFNLIEADSIEDAVRMAAELPWATTGCIEVRPVRDIALVRKQVGA
ncbi:YciI family protein [Noviluteimonas gilva]|uniref:YciI family protein n=1 Tax=Noviluteimonas gilva TaxID=2682097 RepID=A0A7C9M160_9GAMM|nr:YciI family protein [Lysobacter gilvus]MUV12906.1 YciI family protein [Lysobacter gilvus]